MREELEKRSGAEWDLFCLKAGFELPAAGEAELYRTKWFDYRQMHPMAATLLLAHEYAEAHRREYARRFDYLEAKALNLEPMTSGRHKLQEFWNARRLIDAMGIPYDFYCVNACNLAELCWRHLARPEDLTNSFIVQRVQEEWAESKSARLYYPEHPFYRVSAWVDHPDQRAWRDFVQAYFDERADNSITLLWNKTRGSNAYIMPEESLNSV